MPTANPDATVTFPAGVPTGGEAGKSERLSMILRYINAAMERAHYIIEHAEPFYGSIPGIQGVWATGVTLEACRKGGRHELMAGKKAIAGPQAGRIIPREVGPW